jgi:hypothetical protein
MIKLMLLVVMKAYFHMITIFFFNKMGNLYRRIYGSVLSSGAPEIDLQIFKTSFQVIVYIDGD